MTTEERRSIVQSGILGWIEAGYKTVHPVQSSSPSTNFVCPSYPNGQDGIEFACLDEDVGLKFEAIEEDQFKRHYGRCVTTRCAYWSGHCQLGAIVATSAKEMPTSFVSVTINAPKFGCPIQSSCRWRNENGESACLGCQGVAYLS